MRKNMNRQAGASALGIMVVVGLFSFAMMVGIRLLPTVMDYMAIKEVVESVASDVSLIKKPLNETRKKLRTGFITNQIEAIKADDIIVYRDKGKILIDARYETRTHLFANVDAVVKFEELMRTVGEAE